MNSYEWGTVIVAVLGFVTWAIATEVRLRDVQAKLILSEQKNQDAAIVASVHGEPDSQLDADLGVKLVAAPKPKSNG